MISNRIIRAINTARKYPYIIRVGVFGSYARNEETSASDIDLLIDYVNISDGSIDDLGGFMEDIEQLLQEDIDYVTVPGLMKSSDELFKRNVLQDVRWIYTVDD